MSNRQFQATVVTNLVAVDNVDFDETEPIADLTQLDAEVAEDIEALLNNYFTNHGLADVTVNSHVSVKHELLEVSTEAAA